MVNYNPIDILREQIKPNLSADVYYIMNKNDVLCSFEWVGGYDVEGLAKIINIVNRKAPTLIVDRVEEWLESRTPPKRREFMDKLLSEIGLQTIRMIIDFSKGLSLTDTFWVTNDLSISWSDVNLFDNEFDEVISHIAFDGGLIGREIRTTSPEFGTNGMLPKCWVRDKETCIISLKKGGTSGARNTGNEPYSEVLASQVLDILGYNHVKYTLEKFRGKVVSSCDLMTSSGAMMVPIYLLCNIRTLNSIISYCQSVGIVNFLYETFIFDYLTNNSDRHGNNFAVLFDADTYELKGMAPIYDNGCSCLCYYTVGDNLDEYLNKYIPSLYDSYVVAAKEAKNSMTVSHNVQKLINFKFDRSVMMGYSEEKISIIEQLIQTRVQEFLRW